MRALFLALLLPASAACSQDTPEASGAEVFEVIHYQPELIGGMEELLRRIEIPPGEPAEGEVLVTAIVDERGEVAGAYATECVLEQPWCDAAVRAVAESVFQPGMARGRPFKHLFEFPILFTAPSSNLRATASELADRVTAQRISTAEHPVLIGGRTALQKRAILPPEALEHAVAGRVHVSMTVGMDGIARDLSVSRGIWRGRLHTPEQEEAARKIERNALDAVASVRFEPGTHGGNPIPMHLSISLDFFPDR